MTQSHYHIDGEGGTVDLAESDRHRLLADERRRIAIEVLTDRSAPVELGALARAVGEREDGIDPTSEDALERLQVTLHHVHLPILNEAGVITYDLHGLRVVSCRSLPDDFIR